MTVDLGALLEEKFEIPVFINNEGLDVSKDDLFENTVIYLTSHKRWSLNEKETAKMALFLKEIPLRTSFGAKPAADGKPAPEPSVIGATPALD